MIFHLKYHARFHSEDGSWRDYFQGVCVCVLVPHSRLTLCDPMGCSPPSSCPWDFPGKNTGVGCCFLLQGIFPTQGSNLGLLHFRQTRQSEPQGKSKNTVVGSLSFLQWIFWTQELDWGLLHCRQILYQLSYERSPN